MRTLAGCFTDTRIPSAVSTEKRCVFRRLPVLKYLGSTTNATVPPGGFPVQVFFHGGAFRSGNPNIEKQHGDLIVAYRQDFIMITSCDRLGAIGYACFNGIKDATPDGSAGNFGIQDTRHVLKWIQQNIAAFNGNPSLTTITGFSGGSMKVANHVTNGHSFRDFSTSD
eukprot:TRINITY_DN13359_c0_g1_i1.p1 TRINITY_DN13359_c0_g1~~TRINITY_DN13359_c0_g1_i1.p1  ORF type:complete len:168 (-),score=24.75 TRINITY_DN13359_c0_g1_i1:140-643(-)